MVSREPRDDGAGEGVRVAVHAPDGLGVHTLGDGGVAGAERVQEDEVALAQQRVGVVLHARGQREMRGAVGGHAARADAAEVHGDRRAARAAVVAEGHGAVGVLALGLGHVGEAEHFADQRAGVRTDVEVGGRGGVVNALAVCLPREVLARRLREVQALLGRGRDHLVRRLSCLLLDALLVCHTVS